MTAKNDRPFSPKHAAAPSVVERDAREDRPDDAREVELDRVQRDRVRDVFLVDERRDERLVRRAAEGQREPDDERQNEDHPDLDAIRVDEAREEKRRRELDDLRDQEDPPAVHPVGKDAPEEREERGTASPAERAAHARYAALPEIVKTSQLCATVCIHVPTLDVKAPAQRRLKSRYVKALKTASACHARPGTIPQRMRLAASAGTTSLDGLEEDERVPGGVLDPATSPGRSRPPPRSRRDPRDRTCRRPP